MQDNKQDNKQVAIQYANNIIDGIIPACLYTKQACQRFLDDIQNPEYYYDSFDVDNVITFINQFNLTEQKTPKKFKLESWQTFIIANLYGIKSKATDNRKYQYSYIELARKNGKSQLITILALFHLLTDTDAQIVISANSREQIKNIDLKKIQQFANQIDSKQKHIKQHFNKIKFGTNEIIATSADASRLDGLNASFCLIDELHEAKDGSVYNVLKSSQGARENALFIVITTAGFNIESFCYSLRTYCTEILNKTKQDDSQFALIYTIDDNDDINDKNTWIKANPNLNVSLNANWLNGEVIKANNNTTEKAGVLVKNFNVWLKNNNIEDWIDESYINSAFANISITDDRFKDYEIFAGVDLSTVSDISSVSYMLQLDDKFYFFNNYYLPELTINASPNREIYRQAIMNKELKITKGNVIDYDYILQDILKVNAINPIITVSYDKWNATQFVINATQQGLYLVPFSQTAGNLNKPIKEFERLIKNNKVIIANNALTKWMFGNVVLKINSMGNYSLDKSNRNKKIDGIASMLNALGAFLDSPRNVNIW